MNCANHPDIAPVGVLPHLRQAALRQLHPRREGCDLLRELPGRPAARRPAHWRAAGSGIRSVRAARPSRRAPGRIRPWPVFWPDSFPSAWARFTAASMPRGWRTW